MKIAILGGSFDPPHLGHIIIVQQVLELCAIEQVWLLPVFAHSFEKKLAPAFHRLAMTKFLQKDNIQVSDIEIKQKKVNYTIETLEILQRKFPDNKFSFIIGSDQLKDFPRWEGWQTIISEFGLIVFPREIVFEKFKEYVKKTLRLKKIPKNLILLTQKNLVLTNISSTMIRKRVHEEKSIRYLVPKEIEEYITKHKLYK